MARVTTLWDAAFKGDLTSVKNIVSADRSKLNAVSRDGYTALHAAALAGHVEVVEFLIQSNADVNAVDGFGCSVLQAAIMGAHTKPARRLRLVKSLLAAGANPKHRSAMAGDLLTTVSNYRWSTKIRDLLQEYSNKPRK